MKKLDKGPRSSFADAADRLDQAVREIKNKQLADVQGVPPQPGMKGMSAAENWSKNFMTQSIGPRAGVIGAGTMTPVPHSTFVTGEISLQRPAAPGDFKKTSPVERAPMSMRIGKEKVRRRTWLGRLLRGS